MKSFEDRLERLEEISETIRNGESPLGEAVTLFEEGIKLAKSLEKELSKIERKIEIVTNNPDPDSDNKNEESPSLGLFPELDEGE